MTSPSGDRNKWGEVHCLQLHIQALAKRDLDVRPRGRPKLNEKCT